MFFIAYTNTKMIKFVPNCVNNNYIPISKNCRYAT